MINRLTLVAMNYLSGQQIIECRHLLQYLLVTEVQVELPGLSIFSFHATNHAGYSCASHGYVSHKIACGVVSIT